MMKNLLRVICISHPWLQPDHPDPRGENLRLIVRALEAYVECPFDNGENMGTYGVFLDFLSLHQKGVNGEERSPNEAELFGRSLAGLSEWYAHPKTIVLKVTMLPGGYPDGFTFPAGTQPNQAAYFDRGWCFCESSLANLVKEYYAVLDLAKLKGGADLADMQEQCNVGRAPPLTPADFYESLKEKSFTSKKADLDKVQKVYTEGFNARTGAATELLYPKLGWGDAEAASLARVLGSRACQKLETLVLMDNEICDAGAKALAEAFAQDPKACPKLLVIELGNNMIGDAGVKALAEAIAKGALPGCAHIGLEDNLGDGAPVAEALAYRQ